MSQIKLTKALMALSPEHRKQAIAALEAAEDPNDPLTQLAKTWTPDKMKAMQAMLRSTAAAGTPEYRTAATAQQLLAAGAKARGEEFDPSTMVNGPPQKQTVLTPEMITAYFGKKANR